LTCLALAVFGLKALSLSPEKISPLLMEFMGHLEKLPDIMILGVGTNYSVFLLTPSPKFHGVRWVNLFQVGTNMLGKSLPSFCSVRRPD
jgi:hypothetical protein